MEAHLLACPESRRDEVARAMQQAFGCGPDTPLVPVTGGASGALAFRTTIGARAYLIRIESQRAWRNPVQDAALLAAAEAGIAPALHHADPTTGITIMDFVTARPLSEFPGGPAALARAAGALIRQLQTETLFPVLARYPEVIGTLLANVRDAGLFADGLLDPHFAGFERICARYPWDDAARVSSHNDPNPRNFLFDGTRLWLVDWETAYRNEPLVDVAILTLEIAPTHELEVALLEGWSGRQPDAALHARVAVTRELTRLYYAGLMLSSVATTPQAAPETNLDAPTPQALQNDVMSGRIALGSRELLVTLAKMNLAAFNARLADPHFEEVLAAAAAGH